MLREFRDFITKGNLVEIAVGLILALAFAAVVASFTNVVLSFVGAIFGGDVSFDNLTWTINGTPIPYGAFLTTLVTFVIVAFILFLVVKAYNRFRRASAPITKACRFCKTDIPVEATRCPNCTSELQSATA
jgi:large conductance mechanosensitive channel